MNTIWLFDRLSLLNRKNAVWQFILLFFLVLLLTGCGSGTGGGASASNLGGVIPDANGQQSVLIGNIMPIPRAATAIAGEYALLSIENTLNVGINLQAVAIQSNGTTISDATDVAQYVDTSLCMQVAANATCQIKIFVPTFLKSGYLLRLSYVSTSGTSYNLSEPINIVPYMPEQSGFIFAANTFEIPNTQSGMVNVPFRLADTFSSIQVSLSGAPVPYSCSSPGYNQNTLCTAYFPVQDLRMHDQNAFTLSGYSINANEQRSVMLPLTLTNTQGANLITSGINTSINTDNGNNPQQIFLKNNGLVSATNMIITTVYPIFVESNTCATTLAAGGSCSFYINVTGSVPSGQGNSVVTYYSGQATQAVYSNVYYVSPIPSPALALATSGSFVGVQESTSATETISITNTGSVALTNLQYSNITSQKANMLIESAGTCVSGESLAVTQYCTVILQYSPKVVESGTVNFVPTANYIGPSGNSLTYTNSTLTIPYSVASGTFIAVGDFGMVFTSPSGASGAGTWTANVNSPFATSTMIAAGIVDESGTYVMSESASSATLMVIESSTLNGLFWVNTGESSLDSSGCGVAFDGTYYYSCGTTIGTTLTGCTTSGDGCIIRTNNLSGGWTGVYQGANPVDGIFYFTFGASTAYIATISVAATNNVIASLTGASGSFTAPGTSSSSIMYTAIMNSNTGLISAWNSSGHNAMSPISTATTAAWTLNSANSPGGVVFEVTGIAYESYAGSDVYVVVGLGVLPGNTGGNQIYTLGSNLAGAFTSESTISSVAYLYSAVAGNGTVLVVGQSGVNVVSTAPTTTSWTQQTPIVTGQSTNPNLFSTYYDSAHNNFWIGGASVIAESTTASNWVIPGLQSITENGGSSSYLAVDNLGNIYSSSNLSTWTQQTNPSGKVLNSIYCVVANTCFAVGRSGTIESTTNGSTWSSATSGTSTTLNSIFCQPGTCVAVGGTGAANSGTAVLSNSPYTTWTVESSGMATTSLNGVTYYNGKYIAVGNSGTIFASTNGTTWTSESSTVAQNLNEIACGDGCVAVGNAGTIIHSPDGISWATGTAATSNDLLSVAYSNGFAAVAKGGSISYSSNGLSWTAATWPATSSNANNLYSIIAK